MTRSRAALAGLALIGWIALVCVLAWPLPKALATNLPFQASQDALYSMWALSWQTHALLDQPAHYFDANIYHPAPNALTYGPVAMGALPLFGPVFALTGNAVLAINVLLLGGCALTAWTIGLVVTRWTDSAAAGAIAGATFLAAPWVMLDWVPSCPHFAMLMWFPLILERAARPAVRRRDAAILAALMILQGAVEIVYIAPVVTAPVAAIAALRLFRRDTRSSGLWLSAAVMVSILAWAPLVMKYVAMRRANPALAVQTAWLRGTEFGGWEAAPVLPWDLFGRWVPRGYFLPPQPMELAPVAFLLIGAGAVCAFRSRRRDVDHRIARAWRHAAFWTVVGTLLSLPPRVEMAGHPIALPHIWLYEHLPAIRVLRVSARLAVTGLIGLSLLTGMGFAALERSALARVRGAAWARVASWTAAALLALVFVLQPRLGIGYPPGFTVRTRGYPPALGLQIVAAPYAGVLRTGSGPLLEINNRVFARGPTGLNAAWAEETGAEANAMVRSIGHWWPLLNGYSSYFPAQYERTMWLAAQLPGDLGALDALRQETGLQLILVWPKQLVQRRMRNVAKERTRKAWEALAATGGNPALQLIGSGEQDALLFRVTGLEYLPRR